MVVLGFLVYLCIALGKQSRLIAVVECIMHARQILVQQLEFIQDCTSNTVHNHVHMIAWLQMCNWAEEPPIY